MQAETIVIILNFLVVLIAYIYIYPKYAGTDLLKLSQNDIYGSLVVLVISGVIFWDSDYQFNALVMTLNWFWFTLLTYLLIEIPFAFWYCKKRRVFAQQQK